MIGDQELLIRARAHDIWEREGRPEGRATAHWQMAAAEIAAEAASVAVRPAKPKAAKPAARKVAAARAPQPKRTRKVSE